jgi:hypothetical protein
MKEALSSSETSILTRTTGLNLPEDVILHSHRREEHTSYKERAIEQLVGHIVDKASLNKQLPLTTFSN